ILFVPFLFILTNSCSDPIFSSIRDEVELEDADVSGAIYSIVRYKDDLYTQNGKIYKKLYENLESSHSWSEFEKPPVSATYPYVNKLAADSNYLYAQVTKINSDDMEGENVNSGSEIWCWNGETWQQVSILESGNETATTVFTKNKAALFCTNAVQDEHRIAYINYKNIVYKLDGTTVSVVAGLSTNSSDDNSTVPYTNSRNCAYYNGSVYFTSEAAMVTNETLYSDATCIYRVNGDTAIYYKIGNGDWAKWYSVDYTIYSLAVTNGDTSGSGANAVIAGTAAGVWVLIVNSDGTYGGDYTGSFKNTSSTLNSYYRIFSTLVVDPSDTLFDSTIYVSADYAGSSSNTSASTKNRGLWSFLGSTRPSWNRE
ncbi:MAG: hypothetical protein IJP90_04325, partial [Treponema sp.]|nr:hypothetical protein [Treponema sp.]